MPKHMPKHDTTKDAEGAEGAEEITVTAEKITVTAETTETTQEINGEMITEASEATDATEAIEATEAAKEIWSEGLVRSLRKYHLARACKSLRAMRTGPRFKTGQDKKAALRAVMLHPKSLSIGAMVAELGITLPQQQHDGLTHTHTVLIAQCLQEIIADFQRHGCDAPMVRPEITQWLAWANGRFMFMHDTGSLSLAPVSQSSRKTSRHSK